MLCFPQDDHERLLGRHLEQAGVAIEWNTTLKSFEQDGSGVKVVLEKDGAEERAAFAYLCGCDGARSTVREGLHLGFPAGPTASFSSSPTSEIEQSDADMIISLDPTSLGLKLPVRSTGMQRLIGLVPSEFSDRHDLKFEHIQLVIERLIGVKVKAVNWFSTYHVHHRVTDHFEDGPLLRARRRRPPAQPGRRARHEHRARRRGEPGAGSWRKSCRAAPIRPLLATYETERIAFARQLVDHHRPGVPTDDRPGSRAAN